MENYINFYKNILRILIKESGFPINTNHWTYLQENRFLEKFIIHCGDINILNSIELEGNPREYLKKSNEEYYGFYRQKFKFPKFLVESLIDFVHSDYYKMLIFTFRKKDFVLSLVNDYFENVNNNSSDYSNNWDWIYLEKYANKILDLEKLERKTNLSPYAKWLTFEEEWSEDVENYIVVNNLFKRLDENFRLPPPLFLKKYHEKIEWKHNTSCGASFNVNPFGMRLQLFLRGNLSIEHFRLIGNYLNQCDDLKKFSDFHEHMDIFYNSLKEGWGSFNWTFDLLEYLLNTEIKYTKGTPYFPTPDLKIKINYQNLHERHKHNIWNRLFINNVDENFLKILNS